MTGPKALRRFIPRLFLIAAIIFTAVGLSKTKPELTAYSYISHKLPQSFDGYRIVQISDYHNKDFGDAQADVIGLVKDAMPDAVFLTGDMVDGNHEDIDASRELLEGIYGIAPMYYVTGNHELSMKAQRQYSEFRKLMSVYGVTELDGGHIRLYKGEGSIKVYGIGYGRHGILQKLEAADQSEFNILLYHGSDDFDLIAPYGYDLVFSGHAHGGIVRLPVVGGVFGNRGKLFPEFDSGLFKRGDSTLVSSRGMGDSYVPRFYNNPEVLMLELNTK